MKPTSPKFVALLILVLQAMACSQPEAPSTPGDAVAVDHLIVGGTVLTMDSGFTLYDPGYVAVNEDRIVAVGPAEESSRYSASQTIDAKNKIVLPGLINGHQHAAMVLFRGLADDLRLMDWLTRYIFPAEAKNVDAEFVYWGSRLAAFEMVRSGTTTFADMYYFLDEVARASSEIGIRSVAGQTVIGFPAPDHPTPQETLAYTRGFIERWKGHPLVIPAVAPHAPFTNSTEVLLQSRDLAEEYDVPLLIHLAETADEVRQIEEREGLRPVGYLSKIGLLVDRLVAAHGVWVNEEEIKLLQNAGVGVIHNPESNMKLASGVAPVPQMLAAGVALGIGTDGAASNNNLDLFDAMDVAAKLHKSVSGDPTVVTSRQVLHAATLGGAAALDLEEELGSLEAGKKADIVVLSLDAPSARPLFDPYALVVYSLRGSDVQSVMVNGEWVLQNGVAPQLDVDELYQRVEGYRQQVRTSVKPAN